MWEPRRLTTLWVSTACYSDSFTFTFYILMKVEIGQRSLLHLCSLLRLETFPKMNALGRGMGGGNRWHFWTVVFRLSSLFDTLAGTRGYTLTLTQSLKLQVP
jgi:hypothetical protein